MRNHVLIFSVLLLFSISWGFESKNKTRKEPLSKTNTSGTSAGAVTPPLNESNLRIYLRATSYENQFSKVDALQLRLIYNLKYFVNQSIYLKINPVARLHSGHAQSVDGNESLNNRLSVQHAALYYQWMKESYLSAGIFDQYDVFSPLLFDDQMAFMGGQAKQSLAYGPWIFSVLGQTVVPNSQSAISNQYEKEETPMLNSVGLSSHWETGDKNFVHAKANYFKFSQLPLSVSTASVVAGNTSADTRVSDTERAFKYDYYGVDADLFFKRRVFKGAYLIGGGSFIENQGAPKSLNQGYRFGGGAGYSILSNQDLELTGGAFRIEPDATVGAYSNTDYFTTNHMGYEVMASWKNVKQNFRVMFIYCDAKLIYENPAQSDEKMYYLRFEVLNVPI